MVGYSKLLIEEQKERLGQLTEIVLATSQVREVDQRANRQASDRRWDGAWSFATARRSRLAVRWRLHRRSRRHPEIAVRMGIHSGPVSEVADVSGRANIAGAGINMAQRVMDCGDAGHILLSKHVAEDLEEYRTMATALARSWNLRSETRSARLAS